MRNFGTVQGLALAMAAATLAPGPVASEVEAIEFALLPTFSTRTNFNTYKPLRDYLQLRLNQPITFVTAPDYRSYIDRTQRGEYRFLVTAPHFARLAETEAGYRPLARVMRELRAVVVVSDNSGLRTLTDLRGRTVATPEPLAIITMLGRELLRRNGLEPGGDVTVQALPSFNSAMLAVHNGAAAAAITAETALAQMPPEVRSRLTIIAHSPSVPGIIYLARRDVPDAEVAQMTRALVEFSTDREHGARFFESTGFAGLTPPNPAGMRSLDPYVAELRRQLAAP